MRQQTDWKMSLYTRGGSRKYLNAEERLRFLGAAKTAQPEIKTLCMTLAYTGCRISEALELSCRRRQYNVKPASSHFAH